MARDRQILGNLSLGLAAAACAAQPSSAGTVSGTMAVSATVEEACHLTASPLVFGAMPVEHAEVEARSSVLLACTPATSYVVTMDGGRNSRDGKRHMTDPTGTHSLPYELYSDAGLTRRWGGQPASAVSAVAPADGRVELPVFARTAAGATPAGNYADTVTITVAF